MNETSLPRRPRRRRNRAAAPTSDNAIEIAMELERDDLALDSPARQVLLKHARLLDRQAANETVSLALKVLTGLVGLLLTLGLASMVWSASQERGLVIEPFSVPPDFAQRGVTGQVVASRLLDRLSEMGEKTVSSRAASTYANNWDGDIKVQIPQTGVSVGELRRTLVDWLGHQTRIGGELYRTTSGLTLAARTGAAVATAQSGASEAELERMIQAAAESVYATTQPYRYAIYLRRNGDAESVRRSREVFQRLTRSADEVERMWALNGLVLLLRAEGDFRGAIRAVDAIQAISPSFPFGRGNRAEALRMLGHDEAELRDRLAADRSLRGDGARYLSAFGLARDGPGLAAQAAAATGDFQSALPEFRKAMAVDLDTYLAPTIDAQLGLHEVGALRDHLALIEQAPREAPPQVKAKKAAAMAIMAAAIAFELEDWANAHRLASGIDPTHLPAGFKAAYALQAAPIAAKALAKSGDVDGAQRVIATTPRDCYRCVWTRGVVAALAGDARGSDRWFAEAVRQGPSLPFAHAEWGRAKLARGDVDGAIAMFAKAHETGPRWADPLKFWGDALARKGDHAAAIRKYSDAAERAPRWGALHLAWGQALAKMDRADEVQARYRAAARMDLSAGNRRVVQRLLAPRR